MLTAQGLLTSAAACHRTIVGSGFRGYAAADAHGPSASVSTANRRHPVPDGNFGGVKSSRQDCTLTGFPNPQCGVATVRLGTDYSDRGNLHGLAERWAFRTCRSVRTHRRQCHHHESRVCGRYPCWCFPTGNGQYRRPSACGFHPHGTSSAPCWHPTGCQNRQPWSGR